jgi:CPA1 family monovalent cation:H+ antiporter
VLIREVDLKLDRLSSGESTVDEDEEGYEEFWRQRVRDADLDGSVETSDDDPDVAGR